MTILFFTADWCGICKSMYPIWNKMTEHNTSFAYELVDCTNDTEKAIQYTVSNLPTFLAVDEIGTPIDRRSGFLSELNFQKWLDSLK